MSKEAYLVAGVRTAIGNFGGTLAPVRTDDLAAIAIEGLLKKVPSLDWPGCLFRLRAKP